MQMISQEANRKQRKSDPKRAKADIPDVDFRYVYTTVIDIVFQNQGKYEYRYPTKSLMIEKIGTWNPRNLPSTNT